MDADPDVDQGKRERRASAVSNPAMADGVYEAALETLLACASRPPGAGWG